MSLESQLIKESHEYRVFLEVAIVQVIRHIRLTQEVLVLKRFL